MLPVPIAPDSVQEFLSSNITAVRLNLNQWKKLGCPIELFEIDYRLYGVDGHSNGGSAPHRVTYRPEQSSAGDIAKYLQTQAGGGGNNGYHVVKKDGGHGESSVDGEGGLNTTSSTSAPSLFNYEIFNLSPGSWYELIVRAQTEAGYVSREYYFSTLKMDGSTIAPLTLKVATDGGHGSLGGSGSSGSFLSISSSKLAQLHYIVPVSCALFILFLVTVVVCAIHSNQQARQAMQGSGHHSSHELSLGNGGQGHMQHQQHQQQHHFLLSFMTNRGGHLRSDKVSGNGTGNGGKTICSNSSNYTSSSGGTTTAGSCVGVGDNGGEQQHLMMLLHDSTGNPLTDLGSGADFCTGKLMLEEARYGKPMQLNNSSQHRSDSCHSLGGCGGGQLTMVNMETLKMLKGGCENGGNQQAPPPPPPLPPPSSKSNPSFPMYNLPVPYATSAVQQQQQQFSKNTEGIYGTTTTMTTTAASACHYNKGQLSEMYCDNTQGAAVGLVMLSGDTDGQQRQQQMSAGGDVHHLQHVNHHLQHRGGSNGGGSGHQYELPFVFKNIPNPHNESTAF